MKASWYLVQVDKEYTLKINPIFTNSGKYYCMFLSSHENNKHAINKLSISCQYWHRYSTWKKGEKSMRKVS